MRGLQTSENIGFTKRAAPLGILLVFNYIFSKSHFFGSLGASHMGKIKNRPQDFPGYSPVLEFSLSLKFACFHEVIVSVDFRKKYAEKLVHELQNATLERSRTSY